MIFFFIFSFDQSLVLFLPASLFLFFPLFLLFLSLFLHLNTVTLTQFFSPSAIESEVSPEQKKLPLFLT